MNGNGGSGVVVSKENGGHYIPVSNGGHGHGGRGYNGYESASSSDTVKSSSTVHTSETTVTNVHFITPYRNLGHVFTGFR